MRFGSNHDHSEDMFADTRMTFGEHIEDLRLHLFRAIAGFAIALVFSFFIGRPVLRFIAAPVETQLAQFYNERVERVAAQLDEGNADIQQLNQPVDVKLSFDAGDLVRQILPKQQIDAGAGKRVELDTKIEEPLRLLIQMHGAQQVISRRPALSTLGVQEAFMAYFKVCLACGLVIGSPWIFYQIWSFVAAGLYPNEKRLVNVYLPFSLSLFIAGVLVCQFLVIPKAIEALLWFNQWMGLEPDLRFSEWLGFAIMMPLVFGISFQLPLVMMFLERIGLITVQSFISKWRIAFFLIEVFAAVITPSVDIFSMQCLALPMFGLYALGILLAKFNPRNRPGLDVDVPEADVEV